MKWMSQMRARYATKLFLSHLLAVFLVSGSVGTFFYVRAMDNLVRSLQSRLQNSAALLAHSLDARLLDVISGPEDMTHPAYLDALDKMRRLRRANPDIAFLYIMRRTDDGTVYFVVDSDETDGQAVPGQIYEDVIPELLMGFHQPSVDQDLHEDEWGVFLSGYAPVRYGEGRYLVGIDMRADEVRAKLAELRMTGLASLFASFFLAMLFSLFLSRGLATRIATLAKHCRNLTVGKLDVRVEGRTFDEFDDLADAFNEMSVALGQTRKNLDDVIGELRSHQVELEDRVRKRTEELEEAMARMDVLSGLLPICCSCKKVRDDKGYWTQVELFVEHHSSARFTHGICPDCMVRVYGTAADS